MSGTDVHLFNCNGVGGQKWIPQADGTLKNPQSGLCLTAAGGATANGTVLEITACTGAASQKFSVTNPVALTSGNRVSLAGDDGMLHDELRAARVRQRLCCRRCRQSSSAGDKADATWIVRPGLSNAACVSFESSNFANGYLRQTGSAQILQNINDGTPGFATDATFCPVPGTERDGDLVPMGGQLRRSYLRHYLGTLYLASNGGADPWDSADLLDPGRELEPGTRLGAVT